MGAPQNQGGDPLTPPHLALKVWKTGGGTPKPGRGPPHLLGLAGTVEAPLHVGVLLPVAVAVGVVGEEGVEGSAGGPQVVLHN